MKKNFKLQLAIKEALGSQFQASRIWGCSENRVSSFVSRRAVPTQEEFIKIQKTLGKSLKSLGFSKEEIEKSKKVRGKNDKRGN